MKGDFNSRMSNQAKRKKIGMATISIDEIVKYKNEFSETKGVEEEIMGEIRNLSTTQIWNPITVGKDFKYIETDSRSKFRTDDSTKMYLQYPVLKREGQDD